MDTTQSLKALGYSEQWLEYEILSLEQLSEQFIDYVKLGSAAHPEHYRADTIIMYLRRSIPLSDAQLKQLLEIVESDYDAAIDSNLVHLLLAERSWTDMQFERVCEYAIGIGYTKLARRHCLLRSIRTDPVQGELLSDCVEAGDSVVHRELLESENLTVEVCRRLMEHGANRAVRNVARQKLKQLS